MVLFDTWGDTSRCTNGVVTSTRPKISSSDDSSALSSFLLDRFFSFVSLRLGCAFVSLLTLSPSEISQSCFFHSFSSSVFCSSTGDGSSISRDASGKSCPVSASSSRLPSASGSSSSDENCSSLGGGSLLFFFVLSRDITFGGTNKLAGVEC